MVLRRVFDLTLLGVEWVRARFLMTAPRVTQGEA